LVLLEVSEQAHQLGETLATASGISHHRPVETSGPTFPHLAESIDEEVVANVVPLLF
jgi:hypothetical protein